MLTVRIPGYGAYLPLQLISGCFGDSVANYSDMGESRGLLRCGRQQNKQDWKFRACVPCSKVTPEPSSSPGKSLRRRIIYDDMVHARVENDKIALGPMSSSKDDAEDPTHPGIHYLTGIRFYLIVAAYVLNILPHSPIDIEHISYLIL